MTIRKGEDWGSRRTLSKDAPIATSDRSLAALFSIDVDDETRSTLHGPPLVGLLPTNPSTGAVGDLARTVSAHGTKEALRSGERTSLPIDLAVVSIDGVDVVMAASIVIRRRLWLGVVEGAMNASFLGEWNTTPSGHPNDGRLDVVRAELPFNARFKARKRLPAGTHVPHPNIEIRRLKSGSFTPHKGARVWVDGVCFGGAHRVDFVVHPDATTVVI
ncbi:MAG: diacylglycerol kinase family enzyme [Verrucomicrobiales bacterium]